MPRFSFALALVLRLAVAASAVDRPAPPTPQDLEFFETKVRPLLAEHCFSCHGPAKQKGDLRLDSRASLLNGNDLGPVIVPGEPDKSRLVHAIRHKGDVKMPPKGKLPDAAIEALTSWVRNGAAWPEAKATSKTSVAPSLQAPHWAFQPVRTPAVPRVADSTATMSPVDAFVRARLAERKLSPSPPANRRTLLRRATFDLTGLPPTAAEVAVFEADTSPDAFQKVVDRLLNSPRYGERWGRHWLDIARYADSKGYVFQEERRYPFSYTYRDYVIRSFNEDLPYDQFVIQQLAADRLPPGADKSSLAAMGFLTLGRRFLNNVHDIIDDRLDVTFRGFMGLTIGCARCHDHKIDPIPQQDYYSLYGVFASSIEPKDLPVIGDAAPGPLGAAFTKELERLKAEYARFEQEHAGELKSGNRKFREELRAIQKKIDQHLGSHPGSPPRAMVLNDSSRAAEPRVFLRGNPNTQGATVPRQFLKVVSRDERVPFKEGSGRLELARAIASRDNPLTARVLVNRVWAWHFGQGLVPSASDFGLRSDPPSHPELLDWLAAKFMDGGWSLKALHRTIMLSQTYQQASDDRPDLERQDPENRLLGKFNRQRLDFEQLRDSLLFVAGQLDETPGGRAVDLFKSPYSRRRTVYGFVDRQNLPGVFRTFDFASPDVHAPQRHATTVPQQALYLLNSPFVLEQARALAQRTAGLDAPRRIDQIYLLALARRPTEQESALGLAFVEKEGPLAWENLVQVILLSNEFAFVD